MKKICLIAAGAIMAFWMVWQIFPSYFKKSFNGLGQKDIQNLSTEIMSVGEFYRAPAINPDRTELSYIQSREGGHTFCRLNLTTGDEMTMVHQKEMLRIPGYSADGNYLLYQSTDTGVVTLEDQNNFMVRSVAANQGHVRDAAWVGSNAFCYNYDNTNGTMVGLITIRDNKQFSEQILLQGRHVVTTPLSTRQVAYIKGNDIWSLDFDTRESTRLTFFGKNVFSPKDDTGKSSRLSVLYQWLNYSPQQNEFLFCANDESNWRHLFRCKSGSGSNEIQQITFNNNHSYNGQWIQNGRGFAYIGNLTNHFFLAVRPAEPAMQTNLFTNGHVNAYSVSTDGNHIFAIAAMGAEPMEIWDYEISSGSLQQVGKKLNHFTYAKIIPREELWVESENLQIRYYFTPPCLLESSKKYPVVIAVPPEGNQFYRAWEKYSQFLANIGVYHVAVNHRGIDGYGNIFKRAGVKNAHTDVMAVYNEVIKNPNVDRKRIFLMAWSNGNEITSQILTNNPGRWAGIIDISGSPPQKNLDMLGNTKVFLFVGKKDTSEIISAHEKFNEWATSNAVMTQTFMAPKTGHTITDISVDKNLAVSLANFIFEKNKP